MEKKAISKIKHQDIIQELPSEELIEDSNVSNKKEMNRNIDF